MKHIILITLLLLLPLQCSAARKNLDKIAQNPYRAAIVLDTDTGKIFFEKNADTMVYPASVLKLMTLLIVLDAVEKGQVNFSDMVQITKESAQMGGSQVYLDPKEQFSVEELLYALMVQSANDAAMALAIHVGGSKTAFLTRMNEKAAELGMKNSHFHSVHGLPPSVGQEVDTTTARDLSRLCLALIKKPETFRFTAATEREFRDGQFIMRTHNHLLENLTGCDGLKTGYFAAAGYSIAATAKREGKRVLAIVLGSENRAIRDTKARELLEQGFATFPPSSAKGEDKAPDEQLVQGEEQTQAVQILETTTLSLDNNSSDSSEQKVSAPNRGNWQMFFYGFCTGIALWVVTSFFSHRRRRSPYRYTR